jgi:hypothetical protein
MCVRNYLLVCLEQVAMEFNNLLKREVENTPAIRTTRYGRKVFLGGLPVGITSGSLISLPVCVFIIGDHSPIL